ncbi:DNA-protecting protein DprA [Ruminiclostridium herbifermentans]|uniref:DNA-protecting protein DprA n=1 Tax=Ruminiclostridium herbifermentans TaxID=2488810 RepID=A0A4U7JL40_9FIRM|nr:DNA-processing protein DprA [Ruminiclostridium herbifermentans]QNU68378.1 DNA-protecting protein DprA [Ruminiclostridium herbifermentans]
MKEIEYWIWISSLQGLGAVKAMALLQIYKAPRTIYFMTEQELSEINFLTDKNVKEILDVGKRERVAAIYSLMVKHDIKLINIFDDRYPNNLKQIYDPPIVLYYKGKFQINDFTIAIVGSRRTTNYGAYSAKTLSYHLALRGVQIVSGLARGIDRIAHEGCLDANGKTIAVLGCGLDSIYPPENKGLFENILKCDGLIISEYPPGMPPLQYNFPARNRIISGLSSGVLVVEAARRSGSLITVSYALEQGREVFAVPGNIDSAYSNGTNQLIKDGAKMVINVEDILEEFQYGEISNNSITPNNSSRAIKNYSIFKGLNTQEILIVKIISNGIHHIDEIIERSNISAKEVNNILFMLEMKGIITQLPGKMFEMCL